MTRILVMLAFVLGAVAAPASAMQKGEPVSREDIVGFWTDDGDCGNVIEMRRDGTFITADGGRGNWQLAGDLLTMSGPGGVLSRTIVMENRDTVVVIAPDGERARSTRCPPPDGHSVNPVRDTI